MRPGPSPGHRIFQISVPVPVPDPKNFEFESRSPAGSQGPRHVLNWNYIDKSGVKNQGVKIIPS